MAGATKRVEYLATVALFSALSRADLRNVVQAAEEVDLPAGREMVTQGRVGREFFLILDGEAIVRRNGRKVGTLGPGEYFGELALLDRKPRTATVESTTDIKVLVLGQREFGGLVESVPGLAAKLLKGMADRIREADARALEH